MRRKRRNLEEKIGEMDDLWWGERGNEEQRRVIEKRER